MINNKIIVTIIMSYSCIVIELAVNYSKSILYTEVYLEGLVKHFELRDLQFAREVVSNKN